MRKSSFFKAPPTGPSTERPKTSSRQSIRGRISGPIPIPNPADALDIPAALPSPRDSASFPAPNLAPALAPTPALAQSPSPDPGPTTALEEPIHEESIASRPSHSPPRVAMALSPGSGVTAPASAAQAAHPSPLPGAMHDFDSPEANPFGLPESLPPPTSLPPHDAAAAATTASGTSATLTRASVAAPATADSHVRSQSHMHSTSPPKSPPPPPPVSFMQPPLPKPSQTGPASSITSASATLGTSGTGTGPSPPPAMRNRQNNSGTLRYSQTSGASTGGASQGAASSPPQRKKSTLRGALSKLFGRRKKPDSSMSPDSALHSRKQARAQSQVQAPTMEKSSEMVPQHRSVRSDPTVLGRPKENEPKRSASLPITEYDRALRSHSLGPDDMMALESARTSYQNEVEAEAETDNPLDANGRRRVGTASASHLFFSQHLRHGLAGNDVLNGEWAGLSPRPASAHGRGSSRLSAAGGALGARDIIRSNSAIGLATGATPKGGALGAPGLPRMLNPDGIGRAITSDTPNRVDLAHRRRSRSLSNLQDMAFDKPLSRDRNDEIRYWRESYDPAFLSPLSSAADMDMDDDNETEDNDDRDDHNDRDVEDEEHGNVHNLATPSSHAGGFPNTSAYAEAESGMPDSPVRRQSHGQNQRLQQPLYQPIPKLPITPTAPFAFGNLVNLSPVSGNKSMPSSPTFDSRIGFLEGRMHRVERVVDQLCHAVPGFKGPLATTVVASPSYAPPTSNTYTDSSIPPTIPAIYQAPATGEVGPRISGVAENRYSNSRQSVTSGFSMESDMLSHMSFGDGQTYIGSLHPPSSSATQAQSFVGSMASTGRAAGVPTSTTSSVRTTSTATVRGATSLPALGAGGASDAMSSSADILAQLESERAVRKALEAQVKKLNDRVNVLSTTMYAMLREPTPKPRGSREPLSSPSSTSLAADVSGTAARAAALKSELGSPMRAKKDSDLASDVGTESEGFLTPREEVRSLGFGGDHDGGGINGASDHDSRKGVDPADTDDTDANQQRKAVRTLSLGQLTLGKSGVKT